jgi:hypothetical protein
MPIYHFNMHDGRAYPDTLGAECANLAAARIEAVRRMADLLKEDAARFWTGAEWTMAVTDHEGLTLFSLVFVAMNAPSTISRTEL